MAEHALSASHNVPGLAKKKHATDGLVPRQAIRLRSLRSAVGM